MKTLLNKALVMDVEDADKQLAESEAALKVLKDWKLIDQSDIEQAKAKAKE